MTDSDKIGRLQLRIEQLEKNTQRFHKTLAIGALLVIWLAVIASSSLNDEVRLERREYLTLMIKNAIDWQVGMWQDRVTTKIWFEELDGKTRIRVALDHPNGVDLQKYASTYLLLEDAGRVAAENVLKSRGWEDDFAITSTYVSKPPN